MDHLKSLIREVPDFPKAGINFYDITTLLKHPEGFREVIDALASEFKDERIDAVIGIEARGFIFAPALAYHLGAGFVPVRKPKKLPAETARISYDLEYGQDPLEIHRDAIVRGRRVHDKIVCRTATERQTHKKPGANVCRENNGLGRIAFIKCKSS